MTDKQRRRQNMQRVYQETMRINAEADPRFTGNLRYVQGVIQEVEGDMLKNGMFKGDHSRQAWEAVVGNKLSRNEFDPRDLDDPQADNRAMSKFGQELKDSYDDGRGPLRHEIAEVQMELAREAEQERGKAANMPDRASAMPER